MQIKRMSCKMCEHYRTIPIKNRWPDYRKCPVIKQNVSEDQTACPEFIHAYSIWCDTFNFWISPTCCISRRIKGETKCVKCKDGENIQIFKGMWRKQI